MIYFNFYSCRIQGHFRLLCFWSKKITMNHTFCWKLLQPLRCIISICFHLMLHVSQCVLMTALVHDYSSLIWPLGGSAVYGVILKRDNSSFRDISAWMTLNIRSFSREVNSNKHGLSAITNHVVIVDTEKFNHHLYICRWFGKLERQGVTVHFLFSISLPLIGITGMITWCYERHLSVVLL